MFVSWAKLWWCFPAAGNTAVNKGLLPKRKREKVPNTQLLFFNCALDAFFHRVFKGTRVEAEQATAMKSWWEASLLFRVLSSVQFWHLGTKVKAQARLLVPFLSVWCSPTSCSVTSCSILAAEPSIQIKKTQKHTPQTCIQTLHPNKPSFIMLHLFTKATCVCSKGPRILIRIPPSLSLSLFLLSSITAGHSNQMTRDNGASKLPVTDRRGRLSLFMQRGQHLRVDPGRWLTPRLSIMYGQGDGSRPGRELDWSIVTGRERMCWSNRENINLIKDGWLASWQRREEKDRKPLPFRCL